MNRNYHYTGFFVPRTELLAAADRLEANHLYKIIRFPHVTYVYEPSEVDESLFGEKVRLTVTGYGNDGKNEGFKVEVDSSDPRIRKMVQEIEVPHITISVGKGEEPVNTRYLDFRPIEPFCLSAVFGAYVENNGGYLVLER